MNHESKQKVLKGVAWTSAANWGCQLLSFGFSMALARLLDPQVYGLVALAWVYVAFIQIFVTQGFGMAIIQRKDLEEEHLDSAFWIAVSTALLFCLLSVLLATQIAHLFKESHIAPVVRWLSLTMLFNALSSVPSAILTRDLDFRPLALRSFAAVFVSGIVGVIMAYKGFGVWSLVGQQLINAGLGCVFLWFAVPWRPRLVISNRHLRDLYGFSLSLTGNDILWFFSQKSDQTIVGYSFGAVALGPYSLASKLVSLAYDAVVAPLQGVAFPAFSKLQSTPVEFDRMLHKFSEMSSFLCLPIFAGLGVIAPELIPLLYGPKWAGAVPILQVLSFYGALRVVFAFIHPLMLAKGRAGLYLLLNIVLSILTFSGCLIAARWSPEHIAFSISVSMLVFSIIFFDVTRRFLSVKSLPLLKCFAFPAFCTVVMLAAVSVARRPPLSRLAPAGALSTYIFVGAVIYVFTAYLFRRDLVKAIWEMACGSLVPMRLSGRADSSRVNVEIKETAVGSVEL